MSHWYINGSLANFPIISQPIEEPSSSRPRNGFELLDLLKAHKKAIRRAAVNSFGYIAKAIGPQDVLSVLLTNLKVQERQSRVCSTVAIGKS
jgi:splicing factor 3B subunit 1